MRKILAAITVLFGLCGLASAQPAGMVFGPGTTPCAYTTCKATSLALGGAATGAVLDVTGTATISGVTSVGTVNLTSATASGTGLNLQAANTIGFVAGGSVRAVFSSGAFISQTAAGFRINFSSPSATAPNFINNNSDTATGVGGALNHIALIAGSTNQIDCISTGCTHAMGATFTSNIGIGTVAPSASYALASGLTTGKVSYFSVVGSAGNWQMGQNAGACGGDDTFGWYSSTAAKYLFCMDSTGPAIRINAPITFIGTAPTPTGTGSPVMATGSTDSAGEVTGGTSATSIVVTFATAKTNAPFCTVTPQTQLLAFAYTISTTAITITQTATTGEKIDYICTQH